MATPRIARTPWAARGALVLLTAVSAACVSPTRAPATTPSVVGPATSPLPFIENDYAGALARAREANLPLFVEVWAPW